MAVIGQQVIVLAILPLYASHRNAVEMNRSCGSPINIIVLRPLGGDMLVTESFQDTCIQISLATMSRLHGQKPFGPSRAGNMECPKAILIATLNTSTHFLVTNHTRKFPPRLRHLFDIHHWFHEGGIAQRHLGYPYCTE